MHLIGSNYLRLLPVTAVVACSAAFGGAAIANPAVACAAPNDGYNPAGYEVCASAADDGLTDGKLTQQQYDNLLKWCCEEHGGQWKPNVHPRCDAPAIQQVPDAAVDQPTDAATVPPPTPRLPVAPQPSGNATVTPQPAAPPTTSTVPPPPPPPLR
jgi:hypothetical protein